MTTYIADTDHYSQVIAQIPKVKRLLWIATADLKDLYLEKKGGAVVPLLQILNDLVKNGVEVRLIHAKEPGTAFRVILSAFWIFLSFSTGVEQSTSTKNRSFAASVIFHASASTCPLLSLYSTRHLSISTSNMK